MEQVGGDSLYNDLELKILSAGGEEREMLESEEEVGEGWKSLRG